MTIMGIPGQVLVGGRYALEKRLGKGSMGEVYQARDMLSDARVALKRVGTSSLSLPVLPDDSQAEAFQMALTREFKTLATLRHPHIISVLDYGFDAERQPYFIMDLLDRPQNFTQYAADVRQGMLWLRVAEILQALAYLHRRGVVHRDLKPDNVMVVDNAVKLLDFGLAILQSQLSSSDEDRHITGTLAYMAPEVMQEMGASPATDLYALGLMVCEALLGRHPFRVQSVDLLIDDVLFGEIDLSHVDIAPPMRLWLQRLVQKEPSARFVDAGAALEALATALGDDAVRESEVIRTSVLQSAPFVGREHELGRLQQALARLTTFGQGGAWLIRGEVGVGKSRLIDEFRVNAQVKGALVLRGSAGEESRPYAWWREAVRQLALLVPMSDLEAAVLRAIAPDIARLLGREVGEAPSLETEARAKRLHVTIASLFERLQTPVVLILEDLHWANESLDPLKTLLPHLETAPVLVVGSYRSDERPTLAADLPGCELISLQRLSGTEIEALSAAMLGERQVPPGLATFLERETEGNVYFVVEVMRTLAQSAGGLGSLNQVTLPTRIFADGMRTVLGQRMARLALDDQPMLRLAAVMGRVLDLKLLKAINRYVNYDRWLLRCQEAALLEVHEGHWRFSHDKVRDAILETLPEDERIRLNHLAAEAIEEVYAQDPSYARLLAEHWREAGNPEREAQQLRLVAMQAYEATRYRVALEVLERIQILQGALDVELMIQQGDVLHQMGHFERAEAVLNEAATLVRDEADQVRIALILGETYEHWGFYERGREVIERVISEAERSPDITLRASLWLRLAHVYWRLGRVEDMKAALSRGFGLAEQAQAQALLLHGWNLRAIVAIVEARWEDAGMILEEAARLAEAVGNYERQATTLSNLAKVWLTLGDPKLAREYAQRSVKVAKDAGALQGLPIYQVNLAHAHHLLDEYDAAREHLREALTLARERGMVPWVLAVLMEAADAIMMAEGDWQRALAIMAAVQSHEAFNKDTAREWEAKLARWGLDEAVQAEGLRLGQGWEFDTLLTAVAEYLG